MKKVKGQIRKVLNDDKIVLAVSPRNFADIFI